MYRVDETVWARSSFRSRQNVLGYVYTNLDKSENTPHPHYSFQSFPQKMFVHNDVPVPLLSKT